MDQDEEMRVTTYNIFLQACLRMACLPNDMKKKLFYFLFIFHSNLLSGTPLCSGLQLFWGLLSYPAVFCLTSGERKKIVFWIFSFSFSSRSIEVRIFLYFQNIWYFVFGKWFDADLFGIGLWYNKIHLP